MKLKKIQPVFKKTALTAGQITLVGALLAVGAKTQNVNTNYLQPNKIIKPYCIIEEVTIETFKKTTLDLEWVDNEHIRVNDEILLNEDAIAKYPKDRCAITAFVQYHWQINEKNQKPKIENDWSQGLYYLHHHNTPTVER